MILEFTFHHSTIVGHGTEPGELLLTTINSTTELDEHKIVCECLFKHSVCKTSSVYAAVFI